MLKKNELRHTYRRQPYCFTEQAADVNIYESNCTLNVPLKAIRSNERQTLSVGVGYKHRGSGSSTKH
jgi:hypothetical protein